MRVLRQDLGYALRQLRRTPGFTLLVLLTIALGIGANTAVFSLVNGYLRPLPVRSPDQIVVLAAQTKGDDAGLRYRFSFAAIQDLREQADSFSDIFGYDVFIGGLKAEGKTTEFLYCDVTGNFFAALGLRPAAGRLFVPGEGEHPGGEHLLVLGYSYWQQRFGGSRDVVGRQLRIDGKPVRIVGVAPREFHGPYGGADMQGYMLLSWSAAWSGWATPNEVYTRRTARRWTTLARLKPGVSITQAQRATDVVMRRLEERYPATDRGIGVRLIPETDARPAPVRVIANTVPRVRRLVLLLGGLLILLACMNVANLMLVRATGRQREMAIRAALGSGRGRLVRQMLTESVLLAFAGAAVGVVLGKWGKDAFAASIDLATDFPTLLDFRFDWRVFAYALVAAAATGILIGLWPAFRSSRPDPNSVLQDGRGEGGSGGRPGRQRMRSALAMGQVAGSLVLLIVAGLFIRSLDKAQRMDLGFNPDDILNVRMDPAHAGYDRGRTNDFFRELERRLRKLPGAQSVAIAFSSPLGYINDGSLIYLPGRPADDQPPLVGTNSIAGRFFETLQIPILRGRVFRESDDAAALHVAIVNEAMASRFWPGQDAIGQRFHSSRPDGPLWQVVGVAKDSKYFALAETPMPFYYTPLAQMHYSLRVVQIRSAVPPEQLAPMVEREIRALDPDVPLADLQSMRQSLNGLAGFFIYRLGALQASAMGGLGLLLSVIGVYGVVSCGAAARTHEIGVRMALGARPGDIRRLIFRQGLVVVGVGLGAGLAGALALARLTTRVVLLVSAVDPLTYVGVTLLLAAIALWACYIPARRAMRLDPLKALRHE